MNRQRPCSLEKATMGLAAGRDGRPREIIALDPAWKASTFWILLSTREH